MTQSMQCMLLNLVDGKQGNHKNMIIIWLNN